MMKDSVNQQRADKFLWTVRIFKTRGLSTDACKKGRVMIDGHPIKPARNIKNGDVIEIKKPPVIYTYKVLNQPKNRIPARLVSEFIADLTSPEELARLEMRDTFFIRREKGKGRPTKKERRLIDKIKRK